MKSYFALIDTMLVDPRDSEPALVLDSYYDTKEEVVKEAQRRCDKYRHPKTLSFGIIELFDVNTTEDNPKPA